jgi:hypothetical protein
MQRYNYSPRSSFKPRSLRRNENKAKNKLVFTFAIAAILLAIFLLWGLPTLVGGLSFLNKFKSTPKTNTTNIEDAAIAPPVLNIPYEATNTATIKINGYSTPNTKVEIYFDEQLKNTVTTDDGGNFITDDLSLDQGTNNIYGQTINADGKKSLASKTIQLTYSNQKPKLDISSPPDGQQIKGGDKKIVVSGNTDPLNSATVNGTTVIVGNDGNFTTTININDGDNIITIVTTDQFGNNNEVQRKVNYSAS